MTLRPSLGRLGGFAALSLVFVAMGVYLAMSGHGWGGAALIVFFGGCAAVFLIAAFAPGAGLTLEREHFELRILFRVERFFWRDCSAFGVWRAAGVSQVGFDHAKDASALAALSRQSHGFSRSLGDGFGRAPDDLAALMNAFRERALRDDGAK